MLVKHGLPKRIAIYLSAGIAAYFALSLMTSDADAMDLGVISLQELSVDYKNYAMVNSNARNALIYPEAPKEGINLEIKTDLFSAFLWDSKIEALTTDAQYRSVGLEMRLGLRITDSLEVGYWHHSQHLLDRNSATMDKFPSEDAVQIKFYLFRAHPSGRGSLF